VIEFIMSVIEWVVGNWTNTYHSQMTLATECGWWGAFAHAWLVSAAVNVPLIIGMIVHDRAHQLMFPNTSKRVVAVSKQQMCEGTLLLQITLILAPYTYGASAILLLAYAGIMFKRQIRQTWPLRFPVPA
jgi:hypothetical protein